MRKKIVAPETTTAATAPVGTVNAPIHATGVYTLREAAELSKCSYSTIRRAILSGHLSGAYIGNQPRVLGEKLLAWLQAGGVTGRSRATMP
jgi:excisionase family DNA binding protein